MINTRPFTAGKKVNDFECCSKVLNFILFADDTDLFYSHKNLDVLIFSVNLLSYRFRAKKLSLNALKK